MYTYITINEDGEIHEIDSADGLTYTCWPVVVRISLFHGPDMKAEKLDLNDEWIPFIEP